MWNWMKMRARTQQRASLRWLGLWLALSALVGCGRYVRIRSEFVGKVEYDDRRSRQASFSRPPSSGVTVAVRPPDDCMPADRPSFRPRDCALVIEKFEEALRRAGYAVPNAIELMQSSASQRVSYLAAAKARGAEVVLWVTKFRRHKLYLERNENWRRSYIASDHDGKNQGPAALSDAENRVLETLTRYVEQQLIDRDAVVIEIRVGAYWTESGQQFFDHHALQGAPTPTASFTALVHGGEQEWRLIRLAREQPDARVDRPSVDAHVQGIANGAVATLKRLLPP